MPLRCWPVPSYENSHAFVCIRVIVHRPRSLPRIARIKTMAGRIRQIVDYLEQHHSPFLVSRLILATGVKVRDYSDSSPDDPEALRKLDRALRTMISPDEMRPLERLLAIEANHR